MYMYMYEYEYILVWWIDITLDPPTCALSSQARTFALSFVLPYLAKTSRLRTIRTIENSHRTISVRLKT